METIWVLVIIISGSASAGPDASPDLISGDMYTRTTLYFATEESCNAVRQGVIDTKDSMAGQLDEAEVEISDCTTLVVENKVVE